MIIKIGFSGEELVEIARDKIPKPLLITVGGNKIIITNEDGSELGQAEQDAVKNWLKNNFIR